MSTYSKTLALIGGFIEYIISFTILNWFTLLRLLVIVFVVTAKSTRVELTVFCHFRISRVRFACLAFLCGLVVFGFVGGALVA